MVDIGKYGDKPEDIKKVYVEANEKAEWTCAYVEYNDGSIQKIVDEKSDPAVFKSEMWKAITDAGATKEDRKEKWTVLTVVKNKDLFDALDKKYEDQEKAKEAAPPDGVDDEEEKKEEEEEKKEEKKEEPEKKEDTASDEEKKEEGKDSGKKPAPLTEEERSKIILKQNLDMIHNSANNSKKAQRKAAHKERYKIKKVSKIFENSKHVNIGKPTAIAAISAIVTVASGLQVWRNLLHANSNGALAVGLASAVAGVVAFKFLKKNFKEMELKTVLGNALTFISERIGAGLSDIGYGIKEGFEDLVHKGAEKVETKDDEETAKTR